MELTDRIHERIKVHRNSTVRLLQRLVQERSVSGNESAAQAIIIEKLREIGLHIDIWEPNYAKLQQHPFFVSPRSTFIGSSNVVGIKKGLGGGKSILLNGHIDVVPEGDISQWENDPYSAEIKDGKMFGRGTSDMKGGTVALLLAIEVIHALNIPLKGDIIFQSVIEEESGGAGTLATITRGYTADAAIIPEPTNMKIFPKQQGSMWFRLTVRGKSAHGGTRYEGVSAIDKSILVIEAMQELERTRNEKIKDPLYQNIPIPVPINIGKINGGSWPSTVADEVRLEGRIGVAPEESMEDVKLEVERQIKLLTKKDEWFAEHPVELTWFGARWVPGTIDLEHDALKTLKNSFKEVLKREPVIEASPWGTDGGLFTQVANIPTIVFGPGTTEVAHHPNEFIEIEKVLEAAEVFAHMIVEWCNN
ncbi:peptidase [Bacillus suaedaesalsae]|uniref:Probable succinyl-diaminopimelate desuccinylase n=1 Tax=Bacillus suaedaesalsae TaxID=2810349 RepID=A0ABS2DLK9_9BACI|nr:peptidase [Bacillus suaedaesalsae]MBM6619371.1 peptidase [Bacillus suaedaesalsae]